MEKGEIRSRAGQCLSAGFRVSRMTRAFLRPRRGEMWSGRRRRKGQLSLDKDRGRIIRVPPNNNFPVVTLIKLPGTSPGMLSLASESADTRERRDSALRETQRADCAITGLATLFARGSYGRT